jgi:hypothetical protein
MSKQIDLTEKSKYALAVEATKLKGLLKVLQQSENQEQFEAALSAFFYYRYDQLQYCISACVLSWA